MLVIYFVFWCKGNAICLSIQILKIIMYEIVGFTDEIFQREKEFYVNSMFSNK